MKNVLFVGEHPRGTTGNCGMMAALLDQLDLSTYRPVCFASIVPNVFTDIFGKEPTYEVVTASDPDKDFGCKNLLDLVRYNVDLDALVIVGVDIWRYAVVLEHIYKLSQTRKFKTVCILPYDLPAVRQDWAMWFSAFDFPYVYSEFGYNVLKPQVPAIRYFRPPLYKSDLFTVYDEEKRAQARRKYFSQIGKDRFIFGFIGANQFRKDPQRAIKAFFEVKKDCPEAVLYLHTNMEVGVFNLEQIAQDYAAQYGGIKAGDVITKKQGHYYDRLGMIDIYNGIDCLLNTSTHEGLSWTILESMLCGTPVVAAYNTAQMELLRDGAGYPVKCNELGYIPVFTMSGRSFVETRHCDFDDLVGGMYKVATSEEYRGELVANGLSKARRWLEGVDDINEVLKEACFPEYIAVGEEKEQAILFVQHSSGGDVLMSTQCFKGLKERHPELPLVYMTQEQYQDMVQGNPYIDKIVDYDDKEIRRYKVVYNPHGERILPGGFNNLDVKLYDMYPYFCDVQADDMYIECVEPDLDLPDEYIVIQTAGGQKQYRTYKHMDLVVQMMPNGYFIQLGSGMDMACTKAHLDLREKLTWRESAWVMKNAKGAVVIDSFLAHLAGLLGTPTVVLFGPAPARVTGPKGDPSKLTFLEPNKLDVCPSLTSCWGQPGQIKCHTPCINTINPMLVVKSLQGLIGAKEAFGI